MCRIAGIIDFNNLLGSELEKTVIDMRDSMIHGGPDDDGLVEGVGVDCLWKKNFCLRCLGKEVVLLI